MRFKISLLCLALFTGPLHAEIASLKFENGKIIISTSTFTAKFSDGLEEKTLRSVGMPKEVYRWRDMALVFLPEEDLDCAGHFAWIGRSISGLIATDAFGTCSADFQAVVGEKVVEVLLPNDEGGVTGFVYSGGSHVTDVEVPLDADGRMFDASKWAGRTVVEVLSDPLLRPALEYFDDEELEGLKRAAEESTQVMVKDGDWFAASGCRPYGCSVDRVGVAISTMDGRVVVVYYIFPDAGLVGEHVFGPKLFDKVHGFDQ